MNKNLDLTKILERCPNGTKLYSTLHGEVSFEAIDVNDKHPIEVTIYDKHTNKIVYEQYAKDGRYDYFYEGECTLFPSKDQRDWSKFERFWDKPKVEKFDINILQPFDKILVRDRDNDIWRCALFSHLVNKYEFPIFATSSFYRYCIPYNDETKHLIGTNNDCSEYYKWWEDNYGNNIKF